MIIGEPNTIIALFFLEKYVILLIGKVDKNVELSNNIIHIDFVENVTELAKLYTQMDLFLQLQTGQRIRQKHTSTVLILF